MSLRRRIKKEQGGRGMEAYEYDPPPSTQRGNHAPHCGAQHNGNLADKVFMNSKLNQGLLHNKSISTCPQSGYLNGFPAAHCSWCNIVARSLCLLKAVAQKVHAFWEAATSRDCSSGRQMSILTKHLFKFTQRVACLPRCSPFSLPFIPDGSGFPSGLASHCWLAAAPRKGKRLVKCVPVGYLKTCKKKHPGKSGLFLLIETESSRSLSNHFHLLWLSSCQVMSSSLLPCKLQWHQAPVSGTISQSLLRFTSTEPVMLSNHFILPPSFAFNLCQRQGLF